MAKLTQRQLETHLWGAAGILRGRTAGQDYKTYILSLMFFKRLSDQWDYEADEKTKALEEERGQAFTEAQRKALRHDHNIEQLEKGLKITDGGKERQVPAGFIDITAEDERGRTVVIELKAGTANRETISQILGYMGDLQQHSEKPVRGIIVAGDFTVHAGSALPALPNLELKKYGFKFSFSSVGIETNPKA